MLAIRLQRQGRKGYPMYRVIVQEAQLSPTSGKVVAFVGSYNPHTKENNLDVEVIKKYLSVGAQPTPRVVKLLAENKVKLPKWLVKPDNKKQGKIRFADKLRKNRPKEEQVATAGSSEQAEVGGEQEAVNESAEEPKAEESPTETATDEAVEAPAENTEEKPAE